MKDSSKDKEDQLLIPFDVSDLGVVNDVVQGVRSDDIIVRRAQYLYLRALAKNEIEYSNGNYIFAASCQDFGISPETAAKKKEHYTHLFKYVLIEKWQIELSPKEQKEILGKYAELFGGNDLPAVISLDISNHDFETLLLTLNPSFLRISFQRLENPHRFLFLDVLGRALNSGQAYNFLQNLSKVKIYEDESGKRYAVPKSFSIDIITFLIAIGYNKSEAKKAIEDKKSFHAIVRGIQKFLMKEKENVTNISNIDLRFKYSCFRDDNSLTAKEFTHKTKGLRTNIRIDFTAEENIKHIKGLKEISEEAYSELVGDILKSYTDDGLSIIPDTEDLIKGLASGIKNDSEEALVPYYEVQENEEEEEENFSPTDQKSQGDLEMPVSNSIQELSPIPSSDYTIPENEDETQSQLDSKEGKVASPRENADTVGSDLTEYLQYLKGFDKRAIKTISTYISNNSPYQIRNEEKTYIKDLKHYLGHAIAESYKMFVAYNKQEKYKSHEALANLIGGVFFKDRKNYYPTKPFDLPSLFNWKKVIDAHIEQHQFSTDTVRGELEKFRKEILNEGKSLRSLIYPTTGRNLSGDEIKLIDDNEKHSRSFISHLIDDAIQKHGNKSLTEYKKDKVTYDNVELTLIMALKRSVVVVLLEELSKLNKS